MRTFMKVTMDVEASNRAIKDGTLPKVIESTTKKVKPEASYFLASEGSRSCIMVFDMKDSSEIPQIAEPFFMHFNAKVEFSPCMNAEDLKKGLQALMKSEPELMMN